MISKLICALFGHAPLTNVLGRTGYADVCGAAFDGIGRGHLYLTANCPRCGATYSICNVRAYAEPPLAKPEVRPASSVPDGWMRAIDEALVTAHIGVANAHDTYEQAKPKLDNLIGFHVGVATDPAVNGGYKLMPVEPTQEMIDHVIDERLDALVAGKEHTFIDIYTAMIAAANPGAQTKGEEK